MVKRSEELRHQLEELKSLKEQKFNEMVASRTDPTQEGWDAAWKEYYDKYGRQFDCGNIEFEVYPYKRDEFLQALPDDATDIHTYLQFCFNGTEWRLCVSSTIRHVGEYKKAIEEKKAREE